VTVMLVVVHSWGRGKGSYNYHEKGTKETGSCREASPCNNRKGSREKQPSRSATDGREETQQTTEGEKERDGKPASEKEGRPLSGGGGKTESGRRTIPPRGEKGGPRMAKTLLRERVTESFPMRTSGGGGGESPIGENGARGASNEQG